MLSKTGFGALEPEFPGRVLGISELTDSEVRSAGTGGRGGGSTVLSSARAVLAVLSGVMIFTRWTRRKGVPIAGLLGPPSTAMGTALQAQEDEARELARRQILERGQRPA